MARYLTEVLADSPVALWHLDEPGSPFVDVIGRIAVPVSGAGSVSYRQPSVIPGGDLKSLFAPAACQSIRETTALPSGFPKVTNWSLECWIKPTTLASAGGISSVVLYVGDSATNGFGIYMGNAAGGSAAPNVIQPLFGGVAVVSALSSTWTQNAKHHVVITRDTTTTRMYVNGAQIGSGYTTNAPGSPSTALAIGDEAANTSGPASYLQYPAIYGTALSADRVAAHYNAGLSGEGVVL